MNFFNWSAFLAILLLFPGFCQAQTPQHHDTDPAYAEFDYNRRFIEDQVLVATQPAKTFYVSPNAREGGVGSQELPFSTLEAARDAIRELKKTHHSDQLVGGVHVVLMKGTYVRTEPFVLKKEDSGTREAPILYRGNKNAEVILSGGVPIALQDAQVVVGAQRDLLHETARGKVYVVEVPKSVSRLVHQGNRLGMLALDGHVLNLAQWPNRGYNHIERILDKGPSTRSLPPGQRPPAYSKANPSGGKFSVREPLSLSVQKEFERTGEMKVEGYLHNDWYFQREDVGSIQEGVIQLLRHTRYGIEDKIKGIPRRIRLVNVLAELDEPGEWYFDRAERKIYIWPIRGFDRNRSKLTLLQGKALVDLQETSYVTISHVTMENTGDVAVKISGGQHNLIAASTIRNGLHRGVSISGGSRNGVTGCNFYGLESAFSISGGRFQTLERCYHFATNNEIHSCRRRGYGVVGLRGVGLYFAHNLLHDMNGAVHYNTVDSLLEFNEFYDIGYEMGDFNVAYCGANWYSMNNVVRFNFVHHLIEPGGHPIAGFRNDDGGAGMKVYGNIFYRSGRGSVQFAGPLNEFVNNISLDSNMMWWTNKRPLTEEEVKHEWDRMARFGRDLPKGDKGDNIFIMEKLIGEKGWLKSPWKDEFPELAKVIDTNPFAQTLCRIKTNYIANVSNPCHIHGGSGTLEGMESKESGVLADLPRECEYEMPRQIPLHAFVNLESLDLNVKKDFPLFAGFRPIPFEEIGLVKDRFRPDPPTKSEYRTEVLRKYQNDKGRSYNAERVNARYPRKSFE